MPLQPAISMPLRTRKNKERESRSGPSTSSSSSRKTPRSTDPTPPQSPSTSAPSLYTQQNITLDKLPPLPESGAASPVPSLAEPYGHSPSLPRSIPLAPPIEEISVRPIPPQPTVEEEEELGTETLLNQAERQSGESELDRNLLTLCSSASFGVASQDNLGAGTTPQDGPEDDPASPIEATADRPSAPSLWTQSQPQSPHQIHQPLYSPYHPSPPTDTYPLHSHFYPPRNPNIQYYPMAQPSGFHNGSGYPMQSPHFSPSYRPAFPGFGPPPSAAFSTSSVRNPPLQLESPGVSKAGFSSDAQVEITRGRPSIRSTERASSLNKGSDGGARVEDDPSELLHRIQKAIPDLHLLVDRYRDAHGQLGAREEVIRKAESQQADALKQKEYYIDSLLKQLETVSNKYAAESSKLRLEVGNLEEKHKELREGLRASEAAKEELAKAKATLQTEKEELEKRVKQDALELEKKSQEWKDAAKERSVAEKRQLEDGFIKRQKEIERMFETQRAQLHEESVKEKESMTSVWIRQKKELEVKSDKVRRELEATLNQRQRHLEDALKKERESRESWAKERNDLIKGWDEERAGLGHGWEQQREVLLNQHKKEKDSLRRSLLETYTGLSQDAKNERQTIENEKIALQKGWDEDKFKFERVVKELQSVADVLSLEKTKLQRMVECFGTVTDLKSKGDTFYMDAFGQLSKQIVELSRVHFQNLPITPPEEILSKIPSTVPSFLTNTSSSRQLRAAYIQHVISSILSYRVFQPFLFSLGRRYDKADTLFQTMSNELRNKSTRKEAVWRQHTLFAAYTASSAKKTINAAAGAVVEEIVHHIKHFTDTKQMEMIYAAVRRIVKIAAETWRLARLEREMITARMPAAEDEKEISADWPAFDGVSQNEPEAAQIGGATSRKPLLRLLPIISREPIHDDFRLDEDENDNGCIYSRGLALYSDSALILERMHELAPNSKSSSDSLAQKPQRSAAPLSPLLAAKDELDDQNNADYHLPPWLTNQPKKEPDMREEKVTSWHSSLQAISEKQMRRRRDNDSHGSWNMPGYFKDDESTSSKSDTPLDGGSDQHLPTSAPVPERGSTQGKVQPSK
ncbi:MAG: hypothetical protein M1827_006946 [Pycnora praestabilis]|nr:MAG: hypothetical protein M1827_006946 [Pycnora praestabilis]